MEIIPIDNVDCEGHHLCLSRCIVCVCSDRCVENHIFPRKSIMQIFLVKLNLISLRHAMNNNFLLLLSTLYIDDVYFIRVGRMKKLVFIGR